MGSSGSQPRRSQPLPEKTAYDIMSCEEKVHFINKTAENTILEPELEILFNLMLVGCDQRLAFLLETANFSNLIPAQELLDLVQDLFPFFSYTVENWIGGVPHRIFIHQKPLLGKLSTEPTTNGLLGILTLTVLGFQTQIKNGRLFRIVLKTKKPTRYRIFTVKSAPPPLSRSRSKSDSKPWPTSLAGQFTKRLQNSSPTRTGSKQSSMPGNAPNVIPPATF